LFRSVPLTLPAVEVVTFPSRDLILSIDPSSGVAVYRQIVDGLRVALVSGDLERPPIPDHRIYSIIDVASKS
jgi:hypothetical protein